MDSLKIETERLIITELDESMAECIHLNSLDDDVREFVPDEVFETIQETQETINFLIECYKGMDGPFVYPVLLKNGENIGYVQAVPIDGQWEVGYHIAKKYTGKGYATEAVSAFLPVIMERLNITEILGICRSNNVASAKVLEKCSFRLTEKRRGNYKGQEHEICTYVYRSNR